MLIKGIISIQLSLLWFKYAEINQTFYRGYIKRLQVVFLPFTAFSVYITGHKPRTELFIEILYPRTLKIYSVFVH